MDRDSAQQPVDFKIGDKVRFKISNTAGVVVAVDNYSFLGPNQSYYEIEIPDGRIWMAKKDDIELAEE